MLVLNMENRRVGTLLRTWTSLLTVGEEVHAVAYAIALYRAAFRLCNEASC